MALKIVTSWKTLFEYAAASGQAKLAMLNNPCPETEEAYAAAVERHDLYRGLCLRADEMVHMPDMRMSVRREPTP